MFLNSQFSYILFQVMIFQIFSLKNYNIGKLFSNFINIFIIPKCDPR